MISFALSDEQLAIREMLTTFSQDQLTPIARDVDEAGMVSPTTQQQGWELGLIAAALPESLGGGGERSAITNVLALEELGYGCASITASTLAPASFALALHDQGTSAQQQHFLAPFCGEQFHACGIALHETAMSFSPSTMQATASKEGDDWVLQGSKRMVLLGSSAEHFLVIAREATTTAQPLGAFIVPKNSEGLTVTDESGQMGLKPVAMSKVDMNQVRVPAFNRLGEAAGCDVLRILNSMRIGGAALALGIARAATEYAIPYAKERVAFSEAIGKKQSIAFMLADMHSNNEALRWLVWKAASELDQQVDATRSAVLVQNYAQRYAVKTVDDALQIFGGHGFIRDFPLEMWLRNVRTVTLHDAVVAA